MGIHNCWWRSKSGIFVRFLLFLEVCSILFGFLGSFLSLGYRLQVGLLLFLVIWVMVRCSWFCLVVLYTGVCGWNRRVFYGVSQSYFIPAEICCWFYLEIMIIRHYLGTSILDIYHTCLLHTDLSIISTHFQSFLVFVAFILLLQLDFLVFVPIF